MNVYRAGSTCPISGAVFPKIRADGRLERVHFARADDASIWSSSVIEGMLK
jgi:hypothetical protein